MPLSNQLELRHLKYFLAVAEELHFRKAADRLYISQPGLSRQIKQMEDYLGIALFERTNRKVQLTRAGAFLQAECQQLFYQLDRSIQHARLLQEGKEGTLSFGYVGSAMQNVIPNLMVKFRQSHPNIRFSLQELDNQKQVDKLLSQELDIGFVRLERVPSPLAIHPVLEDSFSLVLPKDHPVDMNSFAGLASFRKEPFILFQPSYSPSYYEKVMQLFSHSGFQPIISHETVHANTIYHLVENGFGVSIVPTSLQLGYDMQVKFIPLVDLPQRTMLSAVWNKENRNPCLDKLLGFLPDSIVDQ